MLVNVAGAEVPLFQDLKEMRPGFYVVLFQYFAN